MKLIKVFSILVFLLCLFVVPCFGLDTDLYMSKGSGVPPNILIMFDNSRSMNENVPAPPYDPNHLYDPLDVDTSYSNYVYSYKNGSYSKYISSTNWLTVSQVNCKTARDNLSTVGYWQGRLKSTSACSTSYTDTTYTLRTGNYRNYLKWVATDSVYDTPKIDVARNIIKQFIDQAGGVRVGIMVFNPNNEGGHILVGPAPDNYSCYITDLIDRDDPTKTQTELDADSIIRTKMKGALDSLTGETGTPLAETLYEAGLYFRNHQSYFNYTTDHSGNKTYTQYPNPVQYSCQKNYIIIITDGDSTVDRNSVLANGAKIGQVTYPAIGDQDGDKREPGLRYYDCTNCDPSCTYPNCPNNNSCCQDQDGSDYLDDVAKYLYDAEDSSVSINTFTISFGVHPQNELLQRAANLGGGKYFFSESGQNLADNFQSVIGNILAVSTSYVAPIVPVSQFEKTTAGDKIYIALFKPIENDVWKGNIKKFGVAQPKWVTSDCPNDGSIPVGTVIDSNCKLATDTNGKFYSSAKSYWSTTADGGEVENGGVGQVLLNRDFTSDPRQIYTYMGTTVLLTHSSNQFTTTNALITNATLGVSTDDDRKSVINFIYGYEYSPTVSDKRDWVLGSFIHSRPIIVRYPSKSMSVIFAGSNDGMLHAFNDADGKELWAFIPPNLLNKLFALHLGGVQWFVDGSPKAYVSYAYNPDGSIQKVNQAILIFGERRGGNCYIALDITNPTSPNFLWKIDSTTSGYGEIGATGQTWSTPEIGKIDDGTVNGKWVAFIGGGYDSDNQDLVDPYTSSLDSKGRAVYVVDITTGAKIWRWSNAEDATMTYSIPSDIAKVDTNGDGKIDRLYVGDMAGRMWRFDISGSDTTKWGGKIIFESNPGYDGSTGRRIFYPPDVTLENDNGNYEMLFFGTGDREHPSDKTIINRLYAIKDKNPSTPYNETNDLVDVTSDLLQTGTPDEKIWTLTQLNAKNGWFIQLIPSNSGEKCLASTVVFSKTAYFTTFSPATDAPVGGDPCYVGEGTAKLYELGYKNGNAVYNLDGSLDNEISMSDRSEVIGTSIPSGVIVTFVWGEAVAYTGVGGGVDTPHLTSSRSIYPMSWQIVF
jgi:type IV pilus assembly protein PilY1